MKKIRLALLFLLVSSSVFSQDLQLVIQFRDLVSKAPVPCVVDLTVNSSDSTNFHGKGGTTAEGVFKFSLDANSSIKIKARKKGYLPTVKVITNFTEEEVATGLATRQYTLERLEVGKSVKVDDIFFEKGSYKLMPDSYESLDQLVNMMNDNPEMVIELAGHTDNLGSKKASIKLSEDRVEEVKKYLVKKGIKANRIKPVGYGGAYPVASGSTEEALSQNRRVEFKILKL